MFMIIDGHMFDPEEVNYAVELARGTANARVRVYLNDGRIVALPNHKVEDVMEKINKELNDVYGFFDLRSEISKAFEEYNAELMSISGLTPGGFEAARGHLRADLITKIRNLVLGLGA